MNARSPSPIVSGRPVYVIDGAASLSDGVSEDPDVIDAAMLFGAGFAPFRGGSPRYARQRGVAEVKARLEELSRKYGECFRPTEGWSKLEA